MYFGKFRRNICAQDSRVCSLFMVGLVIIWIPISNNVFNALVSSELAMSIS